MAGWRTCLRALEQLHGLDISGGRVEAIRCYLTGRAMHTGRYPVNRYVLRDKHGASRIVYNAKVNIHRTAAEPIFLGIQNEELWNFDGVQLEPVDRQAIGKAPGPFPKGGSKNPRWGPPRPGRSQ